MLHCSLEVAGVLWLKVQDKAITFSALVILNIVYDVIKPLGSPLTISGFNK